MKKTFALLIACLYLAVSSGLAVQIHHCMGKVSGVTLVPSNKNKCGKCGMEKGANKCCKDELKFVKLQDSYKLSSTEYRLPIPEIDLNNNNLYLANQSFTSQISHNEYNSHSPPGGQSVPRCIMNCIFRI